MQDLISRQAAIDAIKELCQHYTPTKSVDHPHMNFVIEELENLPSASQWIPVSEDSLPDERQWCLVCEDGRVTIDQFIGRPMPYKWAWFTTDYDAWMPLPEPYKPPTRSQYRRIQEQKFIYCEKNRCQWYDGKKCNSPNDPSIVTGECDFDWSDKCPSCGKLIAAGDDDDGECPYCGADMRGEQT